MSTEKEEGLAMRRWPMASSALRSVKDAAAGGATAVPFNWPGHCHTGPKSTMGMQGGVLTGWTSEPAPREAGRPSRVHRLQPVTKGLNTTNKRKRGLLPERPAGTSDFSGLGRGGKHCSSWVSSLPAAGLELHCLLSCFSGFVLENKLP